MRKAMLAIELSVYALAASLLALTLVALPFAMKSADALMGSSASAGTVWGQDYDRRPNNQE